MAHHRSAHSHQHHHQHNTGELISLEFTVKYAGVLSQAESDPKMWVYVGLPTRHQPVHVRLPENDPDKAVPVKLQYLYDPRQPLPIDTKVCFYATCKRENDTLAKGAVSGGFGVINLVDMRQGIHGPNGVFKANVELRHLSCDGRIKGGLVVEARRQDINISNRIQWENVPINASLYNTDRDPNEIELEMVNYIKSVMHLEMTFPNTFPDTANVRIPIYYGDVGLLNAQAPLPAAAYFLYQTPDSNLRFWTNCAENVARNDGHTLHDLDRMDVTHRARFMAMMICAVVQRLDYHADVNDLNEKPHRGIPGFIKQCVSCGNAFDPSKVVGAERFGDALRDKCGDCEDLDVAISMEFDAFLMAYDRGDFKDHKQLNELGRIADQYIYFNSLDSVTAAAVKAEGQVKRKLGAHMKGQFMPAIYVKECIDRGAFDVSKVANDAGFKRKAGIIAATIGASVDTAKSLPFKPFSHDAKELPVLIAEGTGMFEPYGIERDPIEGPRNFVNKRMPSTSAGRKLIVRKPGKGNAFFVGSMLVFTSYWYKLGFNVGGAWLGYSGAVAQANARIGAEIGVGKGPGAEDLVQHFQRGVTFEEISNKSERISIVPHPAISDRCMEWMRRAVRVRVPPRDLILTEAGIAKQPEKMPALDAICKYASGMNREVLVKQEPVPVYFQSHQLVDKVVRALEADIKNNPEVARVGYTCEHWTDWMFNYKVTFVTNVTNVTDQ